MGCASTRASQKVITKTSSKKIKKVHSNGIIEDRVGYEVINSIKHNQFENYSRNPKKDLTSKHTEGISNNQKHQVEPKLEIKIEEHEKLHTQEEKVETPKVNEILPFKENNIELISKKLTTKRGTIFSQTENSLSDNLIEGSLCKFSLGSYMKGVDKTDTTIPITEFNSSDSKENSDSKLNTITLKIQASKFEAMYPLWIDDCKKVTFAVKGKWKPDVTMEEVDSGGIVKEDDNEFNQGALIGRVLGGDYFTITDGLIYESRTSGPIFFKMHLNNLKMNPTGYLTVKLTGATSLKFKKIEEKVGWIAKELDTTIGTDIKLTEIEQQLLIYINKMRVNPPLFSQQYLENIRYFTETTNRLYSNLVSYTTRLKPLKVNQSLINLNKDIYSSSLNCGVFSKEEMEKQLKLLNKKRENRLVLSFKKHEDGKPLSILIKMIVDDKIRKNILNDSFEEIGLVMFTADKITTRFNTTLLIFSDKEENLEEEILVEAESKSNDPKEANTSIKNNFAI